MRKTKEIALLGLMLALMLTLSALEHMLPPLPLLPPGVKLGLSNIVVMYCVFFGKGKEAAVLNALKAFFVFLMRGTVAGILSFCGGMLSIAAVILITVLFKDRVSYIAAGVIGAAAHNMGQYAAISVILGFGYMLYYIPVLLAGGVLMGILTGVLLKVILPVFKKIFG